MMYDEITNAVLFHHAVLLQLRLAQNGRACAWVIEVQLFSRMPTLTDQFVIGDLHLDLLCRCKKPAQFV